MKPQSRKSRSDKGISRGTRTPIYKDGRVCTMCKKRKLWEDFNVDKRKVFGRASRCRSCHNKVTRKLAAKKRKDPNYRNKSIEYIKRVKKEDPVRYKAKTLRGSLQRIAKKRQLDYVPEIDEIKNWLLEQKPFKCFYSGVGLTLKTFEVDHKIAVSRGGTNEFDNLCICSKKMNRAKGNLNADEFFQLLDLIKDWPDKGEGLLKRLRQTRF